jgi:hypothetical protein
MVETENMSTNGFLCACMCALTKGMSVKIHLAAEPGRCVGVAEVVRKETPGAPLRFPFRRGNHELGFTEILGAHSKTRAPGPRKKA